MTILRLTFWANGEESQKSGTCILSRTDRIKFSKEWFAHIRHVLREMEGSLNMIFSEYQLQNCHFLFHRISKLEY